MLLEPTVNKKHKMKLLNINFLIKNNKLHKSANLFCNKKGNEGAHTQLCKNVTYKINKLTITNL